MERVRMFDPLLEEDPWVLQVKARVEKESLARGRAEGRAEGALSTSRKFFVKIVNKCFPSLVTLAEIRALQIEKPVLLEDPADAIVEASDEDVARALLKGRSLE